MQITRALLAGTASALAPLRSVAAEAKRVHVRGDPELQHFDYAVIRVHTDAGIIVAANRACRSDPAWNTRCRTRSDGSPTAPWRPRPLDDADMVGVLCATPSVRISRSCSTARRPAWMGIGLSDGARSLPRTREPRRLLARRAFRRSRYFRVRAPGGRGRYFDHGRGTPQEHLRVYRVLSFDYFVNVTRTAMVWFVGCTAK